MIVYVKAQTFVLFVVTLKKMNALLTLKPILTTLVLPATSGLLALMALMFWAWRHSARRARLPIALAGVVTLGMWLLSSPAVAIWLSMHLLPQVSPITAEDLKHQQVQAIVVLGGGVENDTLEYNGPTLGPDAMARLLYGVHVSRITQLPLAYTGGVGWAGPIGQATEAEVAALALSRLGVPALRWQENQSRDTRENAVFTAALLKNDGVTRVGLVTHAWHMPRSVRQFEAAGLDVVPVPMGYIRSDTLPLLQWLPSGKGLRDTGWVIREWLGLLLT
jgi:uncharacterized SAM-binding protein YcdF (DUF218 family)